MEIKLLRWDKEESKYLMEIKNKFQWITKE
jgi:hypothetical protein